MISSASVQPSVGSVGWFLHSFVLLVISSAFSYFCSWWVFLSIGSAIGWFCWIVLLSVGTVISYFCYCSSISWICCWFCYPLVLLLVGFMYFGSAIGLLCY
jgi:hypothetical protein